MGNRVGIALGSNLGNRLDYLRDARNQIRAFVEESDSLYLQAPIYQSQPVDCPDSSPDFFNTVIEIDCSGDPYSLLQYTQQIEANLGRKAGCELNAPRVIDIDILYFGERVMKEERLILPHPRLTQRRFVLQPLNDIRPHLVLPGDGAMIAEHFHHLDSAEPPLTLVQSAW